MPDGAFCEILQQRDLLVGVLGPHRAYFRLGGELAATGGRSGCLDCGLFVGRKDQWRFVIEERARSRGRGARVGAGVILTR